MEFENPIFSLRQSEICRLCGLNNSSGYLIYEKEDSVDLTIADLINRYLPIQVSNDDDFPKKICANCKCQLDMLVKFIDDLLDGQKFLNNIYEMNNIKKFTSVNYGNINTNKSNLNFQKNIKEIDEFVCEICGLVLYHKNDLRFHLKKHEQSNNHNREVVSVDRFECEHCKKTYVNKKGLNTHLLTHQGEKKFECKICHKKYFQNGNLQEHMRIHTGEKPFKCVHCSVSFRTSSQIKTHLRCHSGDKPYKCTVCERSFPHHNTLKFHLKRHFNDRQFICEFCPKSFIDRTALVRHSRTHTGEKPYFCNMCNKEFATVTNFNKHRRIHARDTNSTVWELTTKFRKGSSEVDYVSATIINDEIFEEQHRTQDLFLGPDQVKDFNVDLQSNSDNNLDDLLNVNSSFTSLNSISFSESILELDDSTVVT
ncbi:zinc finger protein 665-like [Daktulosphaira vitifoliae]|uniref:zinc finger protein 665-like n=1 Tax=Daktulosphaira vitifoliae TaxID=58002 RepID=UPI0021AAB883|nr:zinc finger protein 665-like [Daktulosphaira vitifoliae]